MAEEIETTPTSVRGELDETVPACVNRSPFGRFGQRLHLTARILDELVEEGFDVTLVISAIVCRSTDEDVATCVSLPLSVQTHTSPQVG